MSRSRTIAGLFLIGALSLSTTASADDFQDAWNAGMKALGQAKYDEACDHFSRAETISGASIKTRYQLGRCNEERENFVAAHGYFLDAARLAELEGNTEQAEVAHKRVAEMERKVPVIIVEVPPANRLQGMAIRVDDTEVPAQNWGQPLAVEPGSYEVVISAPGMQTVTLEVTAPGPGQRSQVVVPALTVGGPPSVAAPPPATATPVPPADEPETRRKNPALFWTGMGMIIGGGVAGIAGLVAFAAEDAAAGFSDEDTEVPPAAIGLWIGAGALIGVGIPFMVVFGKKVPVESEGEEAPAEAPAEEALRIETVIGPTSGALRIRF